MSDALFLTEETEAAALLNACCGIILRTLEQFRGKWLRSGDLVAALKAEDAVRGADADDYAAAATCLLRSGAIVSDVRHDEENGVYRLFKVPLAAPEESGEPRNKNPDVNPYNRRHDDGDIQRELTLTVAKFENAASHALGRRWKFAPSYRRGREEEWVAEQRAEGIALPIDPVPAEQRDWLRTAAYQELKRTGKGRSPKAIDLMAVRLWKSEQAAAADA